MISILGRTQDVFQLGLRVSGEAEGVIIFLKIATFVGCISGVLEKRWTLRATMISAKNCSHATSQTAGGPWL
ncbi:hypothetical protein BDW_08400 [Bdellovibrio bacteriovorus W]|nr:hypothetical protein BDW_08400 [Bdellovibrio bacteriovorus W]